MLDAHAHIGIAAVHGQQQDKAQRALIDAAALLILKGDGAQRGILGQAAAQLQHTAFAESAQGLVMAFRQQAGKRLRHGDGLVEGDMLLIAFDGRRCLRLLFCLLARLLGQLALALGYLALAFGV